MLSTSISKLSMLIILIFANLLAAKAFPRNLSIRYCHRYHGDTKGNVAFSETMIQKANDDSWWTGQQYPSYQASWWSAYGTLALAIGKDAPYEKNVILVTTEKGGYYYTLNRDDRCVARIDAKTVAAIASIMVRQY
jgi:hypothetical protein